MKKKLLLKIVAVALVVTAALPSYSGATTLNEGGYTAYQKAVLTHKKNKDISVSALPVFKGSMAVNVFYTPTGHPIGGSRIFSITNDDEVFLLGTTNSKGNLYFEEGFAERMQLVSPAGYKRSKKYHLINTIKIIVAVTEIGESVIQFNNTKRR